VIPNKISLISAWEIGITYERVGCSVLGSARKHRHLVGMGKTKTDQDQGSWGLGKKKLINKN
jgi:hypothetical protein